MRLIVYMSLIALSGSLLCGVCANESFFLEDTYEGFPTLNQNYDKKNVNNPSIKLTNSVYRRTTDKSFVKNKQESDVIKVNRLIEEYNKHYRSGDYSRAIETLRKIIDSGYRFKSGVLYARFELGRILFVGPKEIRNPEEAISWLESARQGNLIIFAEFYLACQNIFYDNISTKSRIKSFSLKTNEEYLKFYEDYWLHLLSGGSMQYIAADMVEKWLSCSRFHGATDAQLEGFFEFVSDPRTLNVFGGLVELLNTTTFFRNLR